MSASFARLNRTDRGFDFHNVLTLQLAPPARITQPQARAQFVATVLNRITELPGIAAAGTTQTTWQLLSSMQSRIEIDGRVGSAEENLFVKSTCLAWRVNPLTAEPKAVGGNAKIFPPTGTFSAAGSFRETVLG